MHYGQNDKHKHSMLILFKNGKTLHKNNTSRSLIKCHVCPTYVSSETQRETALMDAWLLKLKKFSFQLIN